MTHNATMKRPAVRSVTCQCCKDLTGLKRGTLTCIGLHNGHTGPFTDRVRWVVRCDCGAYDIRRTGALTKRSNMDDVCGFCHDERYRFKKNFHAEHGRWPDYYEFPKIEPRKGLR